MIFFALRRRLLAPLATIALIAGQLVAGQIAHAQTVTPFVDSLDPASITTYAGNPGTYTAESPIYSTNTITTTPESGIDGVYGSTSHTWTSINDSYVPGGMTAPSSTNKLTSFGQYTTSINNSDGKAGDKFLYTDFNDSQPYDTSGTIYGVQSVYLVSSLITVKNGSVITFWTEGDVTTASSGGSAYFGDRLKLLFSTSSASTFNIGGYFPTGSTTGSNGGQATYDQGNFAKTLLDINPNYAQDGTGTVSTGTSTASGSYPTKWTQYRVTMSGLPTTANNTGGNTTGRFAFQYLEPHANSHADDGYGNDIEIDDFTANLPEPGSLALLGLSGLPVVGDYLRRAGKRT